MVDNKSKFYRVGYKCNPKRTAEIARVKVYLAGPFFNEEQRRRVDEAADYLYDNPTVQVIHCPFDFQSRNASVDDDQNGFFGSNVWIQNTFQNDIFAMSTSDVGVFLDDLDDPDSGTYMELGYMYSLHKPIIWVPFYKNTRDTYKINLMVAGGETNYIDGNTEFSKLAKFNFDHPQAETELPFEVF